jgi:hypothetical protein
LSGTAQLLDVGVELAKFGGGATMHRVQCSDSLLELVCHNETAPPAVGGGIPGAVELRYLTLIISNLDEVLAECADACLPVVVPATDLRPGVSSGSDSDANWIEFVEGS